MKLYYTFSLAVDVRIHVYSSTPSNVICGQPVSFKEDGLVLTQEELLPIAVECVQARVPHISYLESQLLPVSISGTYIEEYYFRK